MLKNRNSTEKRKIILTVEQSCQWLLNNCADNFRTILPTTVEKLCLHLLNNHPNNCWTWLWLWLLNNVVSDSWTTATVFFHFCFYYDTAGKPTLIQVNISTHQKSHIFFLQINFGTTYMKIMFLLKIHVENFVFVTNLQ